MDNNINNTENIGNAPRNMTKILVSLFLIVILLFTLVFVYVFRERLISFFSQKEVVGKISLVENVEKNEIAAPASAPIALLMGGKFIYTKFFDGVDSYFIFDPSKKTSTKITNIEPFNRTEYDEPDLAGVDVSQNGRMVYVTRKSSHPHRSSYEFWITDEKFQNPKKIFTTDDGREVSVVDISPDGKHIFYISYSLVEGTRKELAYMNASGADRRILISPEEWKEKLPCESLEDMHWSQDNSKIYIAFSGDNGCTEQSAHFLYSVDRETRNIGKFFLPESEQMTLVGGHISFSRDGERVLYYNGYGNELGSTIAKIADISSGSVVKTLVMPTGENLVDSIFSPDGTKVVMTTWNKNRGGNINVMLVYNIVSGTQQEIFRYVPRMGGNSAGTIVVIPLGWIDDSTVLFTNVSLTEDRDLEYLYSIKADGTEKQVIDSGWSVSTIFP